jgi:hypothetical protein
MFRNWLNGSRDLYLVRSSDGGRTFTGGQKLGMGTWKLNGCPMDGGGVYVDGSGAVHTVWQREGSVYYCRPGEPETKIGKGRNCSITGTAGHAVISMQTGDSLKLFILPHKKEIAVGSGSFLKSIVLPDGKIYAVWEQDKKIQFGMILQAIE